MMLLLECDGIRSTATGREFPTEEMEFWEGSIPQVGDTVVLRMHDPEEAIYLRVWKVVWDLSHPRGSIVRIILKEFSGE